MERFEKKSLKEPLFVDGHPITWRTVRDAFQRVSFWSVDEAELCTMLFHSLIKDANPDLPGDYNFCLDLVRDLKYGDSEILRIYADLNKQLEKEYSRARNLLIEEGFIKDLGDSRIELTERGHSLRMQKMIKPISRKKADEMVAEIARRAAAVNNDPESTHKIGSIHVYGSYLTDKELLGDLDIAAEILVDRLNDESYHDWKARDLAWASKFHCKRGEKAVARRLSVNNSVSISPLYSLLELVEEGRATKKRIFKGA